MYPLDRVAIQRWRHDVASEKRQAIRIWSSTSRESSSMSRHGAFLGMASNPGCICAARLRELCQRSTRRPLKRLSLLFHGEKERLAAWLPHPTVLLTMAKLLLEGFRGVCQIPTSTSDRFLQKVRHNEHGSSRMFDLHKERRRRTSYLGHAGSPPTASSSAAMSPRW